MTTTMTDHVLAIAQDTFTAMVDGEPGLVTEWRGGEIDLADPLHAWVDVHARQPARAVVTTERVAAERIARALLALRPHEAVGIEDLRDAFGEMANVIGGNLKGLMPGSGALTLPVVAHGTRPMAGEPAWECRLQWRAAPLVVSMWHLEDLDGKEQRL